MLNKCHSVALHIFFYNFVSESVCLLEGALCVLYILSHPHAEEDLHREHPTACRGLTVLLDACLCVWEGMSARIKAHDSVCVCVRRGRTVAIGCPVRGCTCCVCVCVYGAHGSCAREWRQQPSLSLSLILSHSPHLSHSCLTLHSDSIQGPKPLLPSSLISNSFIPSVHLSLLSRHHASGNFGHHYGYPQHLQQHLLLLGGGKGRATPLRAGEELNFFNTLAFSL